jgi:hypothetical protein
MGIQDAPEGTKQKDTLHDARIEQKWQWGRNFAGTELPCEPAERDDWASKGTLAGLCPLVIANK